MPFYIPDTECPITKKKNNMTTDDSNSYMSKCRHCGENVAYAGIFEAELYWNHECDQLKAHQQRINDSTIIGKFRKKG